jgi:hypothetical protein
MFKQVFQGSSLKLSQNLNVLGPICTYGNISSPEPKIPLNIFENMQTIYSFQDRRKFHHMGCFITTFLRYQYTFQNCTNCLIDDSLDNASLVPLGLKRNVGALCLFYKTVLPFLIVFTYNTR